MSLPSFAKVCRNILLSLHSACVVCVCKGEGDCHKKITPHHCTDDHILSITPAPYVPPTPFPI